jgi:hypothetical protein
MALVDKMVRAARLEVPLYEEVERDLNETNNALTVVVLSSVATGLSAAVSGSMASNGAGAGGAIIGLVVGTIAAVVGWALWTAIVYLIGTRFFGGSATWGEVLRTVGYANSPGVLRIFGFIPVLGALVNLVVGIWLIVTTVVAVRQALDVSTGAAIVVSIIGAIVAAVVTGIIAAIFAIPALMMGAI